MKTKNKASKATANHPAKEVETTNQALVTPASDSGGAKTVNLPLSESNKMQPEAGVQYNAGAGQTDTVIKTDPYTHITKEQAEFKEGQQPFIAKQPEIANLQAILNEIYDRVNLDSSLRAQYNQRLGF